MNEHTLSGCAFAHMQACITFVLQTVGFCNYCFAREFGALYTWTKDRPNTVSWIEVELKPTKANHYHAVTSTRVTLK